MHASDSSPPAVTAPDVARGVARLFASMGISSLTEFPLGSGRRVDVAGLDGKGRLCVVEIKVSVADLRADRKWPDYLDYCDQFYFAVPEAFPRALLDTDIYQPGRTGLIIANRFEAACLRSAPEVPMNAGRRKAETLRFARRAAERLAGVLDQPVKLSMAPTLSSATPSEMPANSNP
jgi:hypothetical protein